MVRVFYTGYPHSKANAYLGGTLFTGGIAEFQDDAEGVRFAEMLYLKYEIVEDQKPSKVRKKKVTADDK